MERRTFVKLGTGAFGAALFPGTVLAELSSDSDPQLTRLTSQQLTQINIPFPSQTVTPDNGASVTFTLNPRIARRFADKVYVLFDTEKRLRVFDLQGSQLSTISVADSIGTVRDFYVTDNGVVHLLSSTLHQVVSVSSSGDIISRLGEFGWERPEQLNGPASLTVDAEGKLHILNTGTNTIKVFNDSGAFLFEYGQNRWGRRRSYQFLDGKQVISVYEHDLSKVGWQFNPQGQLVNSFI